MTKIQQQFLLEWGAMQRLKGLDCAAQVVDHRFVPFDLGLNTIVPIVFIMQRYVSGSDLPQKMKQSFGPARRKFKGIVNGEAFLEWAIRITESLVRIHQREVVHGDIHPENIRIDEKGLAVYIDFGQAILRNVASPGFSGRFDSGIRIAPEEDGNGSIAADIYNLGAVLYYLATEETLPHIGKEFEDIDTLKEMIVGEIAKRNPKLYRSNCGVADVISRCVRYHKLDRIPRADIVLRDLQSYSDKFGIAETKSSGIELLPAALDRVDEYGNRLFSSMARHQIRVLGHTLENMGSGAYDVPGDHDIIVTAMKEYLACLREGDLYLTVSLPSFWSRRNLGTNGRYLDQNIVAAQRGAIIRRIFLVTPDDDNSEEVKHIFSVHLEAQKRVHATRRTIQIDNPDIRTRGYYTGFHRIPREELARLQQKGRGNYGLLIDQEEDAQDRGLLLFPVYDAQGVIVSLQFRSFEGMVEAFKKDFLDVLAKSKPLRLHSSLGGAKPPASGQPPSGAASTRRRRKKPSRSSRRRK